MNKIKFENLKTKVIGQKNFYYEQIDSTQKEIWRRVEKEEIDNGTLIVADMQTAGFGTHGRKWYTEKTNNIAFSLVLFPNCHIDKLNNLTFEIAEIWVNTFKECIHGLSENSGCRDGPDIPFIYGHPRLSLPSVGVRLTLQDGGLDTLPA